MLKNPWAKRNASPTEEAEEDFEFESFGDPWTGNWSKESELWSEQLKDEHKEALEDPTICFMEFGEFMRNFKLTVFSVQQTDPIILSQAKFSEKQTVFL